MNLLTLFSSPVEPAVRADVLHRQAYPLSHWRNSLSSPPACDNCGGSNLSEHRHTCKDCGSWVAASNEEST